MFSLTSKCAKRILSARCRLQSTSTRQEFKVLLDNGTLYVEQPLAEALGWTPDVEPAKGVPLTLSGWEPNYFVIARAGSDNGDPILSRQSLISL